MFYKNISFLTFLGWKKMFLEIHLLNATLLRKISAKIDLLMCHFNVIVIKKKLNNVRHWNIQVKMTWRKSFFLWCQTLFWGREILWQKHSSSLDFVFGRSRRSRDRGRSKVRVDERKRNRWRHRLLLATCCTVMENWFTVQSINSSLSVFKVL
jgi:hypothetical protein